MSKMKFLCSGISQKWVFAIMGFISVFCTFAMRACLPLTIAKIVKTVNEHELYSNDTCPGPNLTMNILSVHSNKNNVTDSNTYDWSEYEQGIILGSFYYGYVLGHFAGIVADRAGGKHTLGFGVLGTAICTILTPYSINWGGLVGLILVRILMGLFEGITQPALSVMMAQWTPADERSKISSFIYTGGVIGMMMISTMLGLVIQLLGWPGVYYTCGSLGLIWYLFWIVLCYDSPREHPFISDKEAKELHKKLKEHTHIDVPPVPWKHLLSSGPFWALVISTIGRDWGSYTMMTDMPKYTMNVIKISLNEIGVFFLLLHVNMFVSVFIFSYLSDWLTEKKYVSRTNVRKISVTLGLGVHAVFVIMIPYVGCDKLLYTIVSCAAMIVSGAGFPGMKANVLDLSPNYAGTVMAISHGIAGLCGIGGPYAVGVLVPNQTLGEWKKVFWLITIVFVISNIFYLIFASGEVQEWNDPNFDRKKNKEKIVEMKDIEKLLTTEKNQIQINDT